MYKILFKRPLDFLGALLCLFLLSPLLSITAIGLYFANEGQAFFFQWRPGQFGSLFLILKFKTMNDKTDAKGQLLADSERLTRLGAFVRKTSLDELPQLLNVLRGEMSLIGPRPLLAEYLPLYSNFQGRRHEMRPGITGWAQVNGRNAISWEEKFNYDVWYIENCSFLVDLKILLMTIKKVFIREGISQKGEVSMELFKGNNQ